MNIHERINYRALEYEKKIKDSVERLDRVRYKKANFPSLNRGPDFIIDLAMFYCIDDVKYQYHNLHEDMLSQHGKLMRGEYPHRYRRYVPNIRINGYW